MSREVTSTSRSTTPASTATRCSTDDGRPVGGRAGGRPDGRLLRRGWSAPRASDKAARLRGIEVVRPLWHEWEVAAFPGRRLRHFQKHRSVKEEFNRSGSRVQVELELAHTHQNDSVSGVRTGNAVTGATRFAGSNLARSATTSGSRRGPKFPAYAGTIVSPPNRRPRGRGISRNRSSRHGSAATG